jgi:hypothetical protein
MTSTRATMVGGLGLGLLIAGGLPGCGSSSTTPQGETTATGGTSNTSGGTSSSGGTANQTGGTANQTGGTPNATGGTDTGGTANATGGADTGGTPNATGGGDTGGTNGTTGGSTGTGGTGGVDCHPAPTLKCTGTAPPAAVISNFTTPDGGTASVFGAWGQVVFGGLYVYPANPKAGDPCAGAAPQFPLTSDTSGGNWHITGQVGTYSGAGLWWECDTAATTPANRCTIDASAYTGISFTISGNAGPAVGDAGGGGITVSVGTPSNTANPDNNGQATCGTCTGTCSATAVQVPVTATPTTVTLTWAQLGVTTPNALTGFGIALTVPPNMDWTTGISSSPYAVDITIDDLQFTS